MTDIPTEPRTERSVDLWADAPPLAGEDGFRPWLEPFLLDGSEPRPAVLIYPGGGYAVRSARESSPIARAFNAEGYHSFVVHYRVAPYRHPAPLLDSARAVRLVRTRAREWAVDPNRIALCGFSAGGHAAAAVGVLHEEARPSSPDEIDAVDGRPDALVLAYPVVSAFEYTHGGSFNNLLGAGADLAGRRSVSIETHVRPDTPSTFLWHTAEDAVVPVGSSLLFASALAAQGVPFELHVYPYGRHGLNLARDLPHVATWFSLCCEWLRTMGE